MLIYSVSDLVFPVDPAHNTVPDLALLETFDFHILWNKFKVGLRYKCKTEISFAREKHLVFVGKKKNKQNKKWPQAAVVHIVCAVMPLYGF